MKIGIGAKAGLASGIIVGGIYVTLGIIPIYLYSHSIKLGILDSILEEPSIFVWAPLTMLGFLFVCVMSFIGGYYKLFIHSEIYFIVLVIGTCTFLGTFFQNLFNFLPTKSSVKKASIYSITVWFILGVLAFFLGSVSMEFNIKLKSFGLHLGNVVGWLLYGFLLGKFYDAFSKEPDAGIFYMIKKVLLRKPMMR